MADEDVPDLARASENNVSSSSIDFDGNNTTDEGSAVDEDAVGTVKISGEDGDSATWDFGNNVTVSVDTVGSIEGDGPKTGSSEVSGGAGLADESLDTIVVVAVFDSNTGAGSLKQTPVGDDGGDNESLRGECGAERFDFADVGEAPVDI